MIVSSLLFKHLLLHTFPESRHLFHMPISPGAHEWKNWIRLLRKLTNFDLPSIIPWTLGVITQVAVELSRWALVAAILFFKMAAKPAYLWDISAPRGDRDLILVSRSTFLRTRNSNIRFLKFSDLYFLW